MEAPEPWQAGQKKNRQIEEGWPGEGRATHNGSAIITDEDPPSRSVTHESAAELTALVARGLEHTGDGRSLALRKQCHLVLPSFTSIREVALADGELLQLARHPYFLGRDRPDRGMATGRRGEGVRQPWTNAGERVVMSVVWVGDGSGQGS
jgi:hypothetical protein